MSQPQQRQRTSVRYSRARPLLGRVLAPVIRSIASGRISLFSVEFVGLPG